MKSRYSELSIIEELTLTMYSYFYQTFLRIQIRMYVWLHVVHMTI